MSSGRHLLKNENASNESNAIATNSAAGGNATAETQVPAKGERKQRINENISTNASPCRLSSFLSRAAVVSSPPKGFILEHNAVPSTTWDEIKSWIDLNLGDSSSCSSNSFLPSSFLTSTQTPTTTTTANNNDDISLSINNDTMPYSSLSSISLVPPYKTDVVTEEDNMHDDTNDNNNRNDTTNNNSSRNIPWEIGTSTQGRLVAQYGFRYDYLTSTVDTTTPTPPIPDVLRRLLLSPAAASNDDGNKNNNHSSLPLSCEETSCNAPLFFTQCIINVYGKDTIIPWHVDHEDFGEVILVYTFGETRPLHLRCRHSHHNHHLAAADSTSTDNNNNDNANKVDASNASTNSTTKRLRDNKRECLDDSSCRIAVADESEKRHNEIETNNSNCNDDDYCIYYTAYPSHCSRYVLSGEARESWEHCIPEGNGWRVSITFRTLRRKA